MMQGTQRNNLINLIGLRSQLPNVAINKAVRREA